MPPLSITTRTAQADSLTFKAQSKETSNYNLNGQGVSQRPVTDHNKLTYNNTKSVVVSTVWINFMKQSLINNNE